MKKGVAPKLVNIEITPIVFSSNLITLRFLIVCSISFIVLMMRQKYYKISKNKQKNIEKCRYWCQKSIFLCAFGTSIGAF